VGRRDTTTARRSVKQAPIALQPSARLLCSSRISSAMLVRDSCTSSAKGAFGRHEGHESAGMRLVTVASR
jgi:hypothetical protein